MRRPAIISFSAIVCIALLAACNGNQRLTPTAQQQVRMPSGQTAAAAVPVNPFNVNPQAYGACTAPAYKPPGPFIVFVANGKVKHGTFKSASSALTLWFEVKVKKSSKPQPSASPSSEPSPTAPPTNQPVYLYLGQYTLAKAKQSGCAFLFATQNGKPFTGSKYGGLAFGSPTIKYPKHFKTTVLDQGPVQVKLSKLGANGGSGTATLLTKSGGTFDTAKIVLTYRIAQP